ncbi:hypothetical protein Tco_0961362 [Tanacetum coccineum]
MFETCSYKSLLKHITLYEALEASMKRGQRDEFLTEKDKSRRHDAGASGSSQPQAPQSSAWKKSDTRDAPSSSSKQQSGPHAEQPVDDIPIQDSETYYLETLTSHIFKVKQRPEYKNQAHAENSLLEKTRDMQTFMNWYCQNIGKTELTQADLEDWTELNPEGDSQVRIDISKPLPLSGPPGHVTIQTQFFFNKDLDYLRYGSKGSGQSLSISKMKDARYQDFGLEILIPKHMWINDVCTYDISASYGISHWWFNRQKFYIDRHTAESSCKVVRTHMRILSVVRIKAYSRYGYDYLKEITLRIADHQEYTITEKDFKNLYPVDFEDLNLLLLQGHLNHLPGSDIQLPETAESHYGWDVTSFDFKHDYTNIDLPRAVVFPVSNNEQKIMRFNKIYKFSDGTLTNIMEALDYRVKEYKVNRLNPGMNTRFWTDKDVEGRKEFIHAIEQRLKTRRIFRNLECFVGGRVRDIDYRLLQRTE